MVAARTFAYWFTALTLPAGVLAACGPAAFDDPGPTAREPEAPEPSPPPPPDLPRSPGGPDAPPLSRMPPPLDVGTGATGLPPPITGGHLAASSSGRWVVAADPDRDLVHRWDLELDVLESTELPPGSEPGRTLAADDGRAVVALRQRGELAFISESGDVRRLVSVCAAPRGLAWTDASQVAVWLACASGEVVRVDVTSGAVQQRRHFDADLRDVVVTEHGVFVSVFRSANILWLDGGRSNVISLAPRPGEPNGVLSTTAWRMRALPHTQSLVVLHQLALPDVSAAPPSTTGPPATYGSGRPASGATRGLRCEGAVAALATEIHFSSVGAPRLERFALPGFVLPVDIAPARGGSYTIADAAYRARGADRRPGLLKVADPPAMEDAFCDVPDDSGQLPIDDDVRPYVAVELLPDGSIVAMSLDPPELVRFDRPRAEIARLPLAEMASHHGGSELFHADVGAGITCASCHPEAADDGVIWSIGTTGPRRTHYLRGGIRGTAPFHWDGDMPTFHDLVQVTMGERMAAGEVGPAESIAMLEWLEEVPLFPSPEVESAEQHARGAELFQERCVGCHTGEHMGGVGVSSAGHRRAVQVPRLTNLIYRAPYLHDGCAPTLDDAFSVRCGTWMHGQVGNLSVSDVQSLLTFLETR